MPKRADILSRMAPRGGVTPAGAVWRPTSHRPGFRCVPPSICRKTRRWRRPRRMVRPVAARLLRNVVGSSCSGECSPRTRPRTSRPGLAAHESASLALSRQAPEYVSAPRISCPSSGNAFRPRSLPPKSGVARLPSPDSRWQSRRRRWRREFVANPVQRSTTTASRRSRQVVGVVDQGVRSQGPR